ncbi:MAG: metal-dependent hydrolase, partial [Deltaproteobacteria bacterium]
SLTRQELEHSVREGVRRSLECGTTAIGEILSDRTLIPLYDTTGIYGRLFLEAIGQDPDLYTPILAEIEKTLTSFSAANLGPGLAPHAPHTLAAGFLQKLAELARSHGVPAVIHLAESREEASFMHDSTGKIAEILYPFAGWNDYLPSPRRVSSAAYLEGLGVLNPLASVVHCVHVTPDDARILKKNGVSAILCPRSNDRLDVGKAPAGLLKKIGIPLALGTDSLASNDSLSLWDEMRFLRTDFPGLFTPDEIVEMATLGGAKALRLANSTGSLEKGKRGDFLVVEPAHVPSPDELAEVLIEDSRVAEVFIGGRPM